MLREMPGWGVGVLISKGYMLIFADRVLVHGAVFSGCEIADQVLGAIERGTETKGDNSD